MISWGSCVEAGQIALREAIAEEGLPISEMMPNGASPWGCRLYVGAMGQGIDEPESALPASGLVAAGISVPMGPTLWFSERQQKVTRARWHYRMAEQQWNLTRWDIQRKALDLYLTWSLKVAAQEAYASSWTYLDAQLNMYRQAFRMGGVSQRDTLDLFAARNTRKSQALQSGWEAQSAFEKMSSFLGLPIDSMKAWTAHGIGGGYLARSSRARGALGGSLSPNGPRQHVG